MIRGRLVYWGSPCLTHPPARFTLTGIGWSATAAWHSRTWSEPVNGRLLRELVMRFGLDPLSFVVCVCVCAFCAVHTQSSQTASQTPCPFSENTTCVTKAANLLSRAVSPEWGEKHFLSHHRVCCGHTLIH